MNMKQPHIALDASLGIDYAILPGDPARIDKILPWLQYARELEYNREFRSVCGNYRGVRILALSTGIGSCSCGIAVEELHNIGVKAAIRVGTCGALQPDIGLGELIVVSGAVRNDGASRAYLPKGYPAYADIELLNCVLEAAAELGVPHREGVVHCHESFYHDEADDESVYWSSKGVLGEDMESAALMTIGRLRGLRAASILNNVVLWDANTAYSIGSYAAGADAPARGEENEIRVALEALVRLDAKLKGTEP